jgi:hypothetical protein
MLLQETTARAFNQYHRDDLKAAFPDLSSWGRRQLLDALAISGSR